MGATDVGEVRAFGRLAQTVLAHRRLVGVIAVLLTVVSGVIGLPPKVDGNLLNLLPESDPAVAAIKRINREEGGFNTLNLTLRGPEQEALDAYVAALAARFEAMPEVAFALHALDEDLATQIGLVQLSPDELGTLNDRLRGALRLGPAAQNPMLAQRLLDLGPLTEKIERLTGSSVVAKAGGSTEAGGVHEARLVVRPVETSAKPEFARAFMRKVDALMAEMPPEGSGVELAWMGGAYRHTVEDIDGIQHDLVFTSVGSAIIVLSLMVLTFRSVRAIAILFPPLVVANVMNLAFVKLAIGPLNTYTSFGTAILFGLGIDFAIHLVGRYRELVATGMAREDAIVAAWDLTGPPCMTAAATSAAGFLALGFAQFAGFQQLGVVLAVGLVLCLVAMLVLLPVLLVVFDRADTPLLGTTTRSFDSMSTYRLSVVGTVAFLGLTLLVAVNALPGFPMEYDVSAMRRDGMAYAELSEEERALARESYAPIVVFLDEDGLEAMEAAQVHARAVIDAGGAPHVAAAVSLASVLPPDQDARLERIRELVALVEDPNLRYLPAVIGRRLAPLRGVEVRHLAIDDIPDSVRMLVGAGTSGESRLLLLPKGNMWDVREAQALAGEVEAMFPGAQAAGEYLGVAAMFMLAFRDLPPVSAIALLFVALIAFVDLRKPQRVLGAILTLLVGLIWGMATVRIAGVTLSMVNLAGLPILLGIGVDVVIHLLHRLEEEGPGGIRRALRTTGVAAGLSTLTTVGSFLALTLAGNRGVRGLGVLVTIGLVVVTAVAMTVLPLVWSAGWKLAGRAPADRAQPAAD